MLIDSVTYSSTGDWPELPNGNGNTLELINPNLDNSLASSWHASSGIGTPGVQNSGGATPNDDSYVEAVKVTLSNYPNPFNPQTTIAFSTEKAGHVKLNVYNIKGQLVKTLINANIGAGQHTVIWNGDNNQGKAVSSGIYFTLLNVNNKSKTRKMVLSK